jgi:hypothetical protein
MLLELFKYSIAFLWQPYVPANVQKSSFYKNSPTTGSVAKLQISQKASEHTEFVANRSALK